MNSICWAGYAFVEHEYWMDYSENGIPDEDLLFSSQVMKYFCEALFFTIIEMITCGFQITSKKLKRGGKRYSGIIFLMLGGINFLQLIFGEVVLFITAGIYGILLRHFILNICANKKKLTR